MVSWIEKGGKLEGLLLENTFSFAPPPIVSAIRKLNNSENEKYVCYIIDCDFSANIFGRVKGSYFIMLFTFSILQDDCNSGMRPTDQLCVCVIT